MASYMTSGNKRRLGQWEKVAWWSFIEAETMSEEYKTLIASLLTRALVAAKAKEASTHTIAKIGEAIIFTYLGLGTDGFPDQLLNGPTNEAFIDPWVQMLADKGVNFIVPVNVDSLVYSKGRIVRALAMDSNGSQREIVSDYYILAVTVERAIPLLKGKIMAADPSLVQLQKLVTDWMTGVQFYLNRKVPIFRGHVMYVDSPWALTSISQGQFWDRNLPKQYGDGTVVDILSVDISDWNTQGLVVKKPAKECTKEEIFREVLYELQDSLNEGELKREDIVTWFLDPAIRFSPNGTTNEERLLIGTAGSWRKRPSSKTKMVNLFLASDYVQTNVNLATMEGANEGGRMAVNALLDAVGSSSKTKRVKVKNLYRPPALEPIKQFDDILYNMGLPNIFDEQGWRSRVGLFDSLKVLEQIRKLVDTESGLWFIEKLTILLSSQGLG